MRDSSRLSLESLKPDWRLLCPPLLREIPHYTRAKFRTDALAAATVAMVSIPQAVGFALIAGLPPSMVLATVVIGGFVAAFFFSSRQAVFRPSNSLSLLLAATFIAHRDSSLGPAEMTVVLAALIGVVQLFAGCCRFGQVTQFISRSVVIGYGAAIGCLLVLSQLHHLVGAERMTDASFWSAPVNVARHLTGGDWNPWALCVAVAAFLVFYLIKKLRPGWPEALIGLVLFSLFAKFGHLEQLGVTTLGQDGPLFARLHPRASHRTQNRRRPARLRLRPPAYHLAPARPAKTHHLRRAGPLPRCARRRQDRRRILRAAPQVQLLDCNRLRSLRGPHVGCSPRKASNASSVDWSV